MAKVKSQNSNFNADFKWKLNSGHNYVLKKYGVYFDLECEVSFNKMFGFFFVQKAIIMLLILKPNLKKAINLSIWSQVNIKFQTF